MATEHPRNSLARNFPRRLHLSPLADSPLPHGGCHFTGTVVNGSLQSGCRGGLKGSVICVLRDDEFTSGVESSQDQNHFPVP